MNQFKLPLTRDEILKLEDNYKKSNEIQQEERVMAIAVQAKERGFLTKEEFLEIGKWKTPRQNKNYANNDEEFIKEVTSVSFSGKASDELRIHVLTLLGGVNLRVASAILHLAFLPEKQTYPIMDVRALQTLGYKAKSEKEFNEIWEEYTKFCREKCIEMDIGMRTLDRAIWQFDKNQSGKKRKPA